MYIFSTDLPPPPTPPPNRWIIMLHNLFKVGKCIGSMYELGLFLVLYLCTHTHTHIHAHAHTRTCTHTHHTHINTHTYSHIQGLHANPTNILYTNSCNFVLQIHAILLLQ